MSHGWRAWVVWGAGLFAYTAAVLQRTSFGVAGLDAAERFGAPAGMVATFVVVQLVVYAGLQVPVGILVDRLGPRALVTTGALVMAMGQVSMALADSVPEAMIARVLVGAGDAMTFGSVVRLVPAWFPPARVPILTQLTGILGQAGQVLSAVPFAYLLHSAGWSTAFLAAAAVAGCGFLAALLLVRNSPDPTVTGDADVAGLRAALLTTWRTPGTRLGLWTHYTSGFAPMLFAMMWGFPYLVRGEGRSGAEASALLTLFVLASLPCGPAFGRLTQRYPLRRSNLAFAIIALNVLPWCLVLAWPGPAPLWLLIVLVLGLATGGPGSNIGFDFARTSNPAPRLGTATGIVIMGAFVGTLIDILLVGLVLDLLGGAYDLRSFRLAMATQLPLFAIGVAGMTATRRATRARMRDAEGIVVDPLAAALRRRLRRGPGTGPDTTPPPGP